MFIGCKFLSSTTYHFHACEQREEAGQEDIGLVHVARLVQVVIPDDHDEDDEAQAEASEDDDAWHDGLKSEEVIGRHTTARHQSDWALLLDVCDQHKITIRNLQAVIIIAENIIEHHRKLLIWSDLFLTSFFFVQNFTLLSHF